ncbi:GerMN domain-containing protein [Youngiibacter fragilis]|uniref:Sporulation/spore germination protein n=1 Tax=Youngiibacter fragilis 232.1 TaxID=994573 RepID=V7I2W0_9CLOT|nr:GerMN domain-containing protein [Youngiibacter fragilis]ETA79601.1 sporulation/spore germination protein [Youngiibacter fragilis 232.1]
MKKIISTMGMVTALMLLFACGAKPATPTTAPTTPVTPTTPSLPSTPETPEAVSVKDYFPFEGDVEYIFEGMGNEYATFTRTVDYIDGDRIQIRDNNGGTEIVKVIKADENEISIVFSRAETYFRESFLKKDSGKPEILLKAPIEKGTTWTLPDGRVSTITGVDVSVKVPYGEYKAVEVTIDGATGDTINYYAKGIGLVKTVFNPGTDEVSSSLKTVTKNKPYSRLMTFYVTNVDAKLLRVNKEVTFKTNSITRIILQDVYKAVGTEKNSNILSANTRINSLYLNDDGMVYIDLSKEFVTEMNAGSEFEAMILQSVANTFGDFYGETRVMLTVDDKTYESGHILLDDNEYLKVDFSKVIEQ